MCGEHVLLVFDKVNIFLRFFLMCTLFFTGYADFSSTRWLVQRQQGKQQQLLSLAQ